MAVYVPPVGQVRAVVSCRGMVYPNHTARAVVLAGADAASSAAGATTKS